MVLEQKGSYAAQGLVIQYVVSLFRLRFKAVYIAVIVFFSVEFQELIRKIYGRSLHELNGGCEYIHVYLKNIVEVEIADSSKAQHKGRTLPDIQFGMFCNVFILSLSSSFSISCHQILLFYIQTLKIEVLKQAPETTTTTNFIENWKNN